MLLELHILGLTKFLIKSEMVLYINYLFIHKLSLLGRERVEFLTARHFKYFFISDTVRIRMYYV